MNWVQGGELRGLCLSVEAGRDGVGYLLVSAGDVKAQQEQGGTARYQKGGRNRPTGNPRD